MSGWIIYFNYFIIGALLLSSIQGMWFTAVMPGTGSFNRRIFLSYYAVILLCCLLSLSDMLLYQFHVPVSAISIMLLLESLFLSIPLPMLTIILLHFCKDNILKSRLFRFVLSLWLLYIILLVSAPFINGFSYITPDREYHRGFLYPLLLLPLVVIMLLNLMGLLKRRSRLHRKAFLSFLVAIVPITVSLFIQLFIDVFPLLDICIALSAMVISSFVMSDQVEYDLRHQREIANQRTNIMVLQMRPHFIYNALTSIYCICGQDQEKARQAIKDFTTYLRKNFTAIASEEPIPFSSELEHTRAYLAVEQAQYEDALFVEYDTPHTMFRIPPLTLQPIVENSVKHGRDPYTGSFHISIRTRKTNSGSEIVVTDNGRGFDPNDNSDPGIALNNIRQRLEMMCGGSLAITLGDSGGTVVTVRIPDSAMTSS
ncbi:MAG: histidine kinase [Lachnospiraceae bacterium]|nr:histidine kinase [Lachnospiraceae bacterium]